MALDPAVAALVGRLAEEGIEILADIEQLRGRDLGCFCGLDQPCHVDVILERANA